MRLVLLGDPVVHSRSPVIHRAALAATGLSGSYEARRVGRRGLLGAFADLKEGRIDGANITMPHKSAAAAAADLSDGMVAATGAANTLRRSGSPDGAIVEATNTDVVGLTVAAEAAGIPREAPVLVLGAGGAAAAAMVAFGDRPAGLSARRPEAAGEMALRTGAPVPFCLWGEAVEGAVVINATPLGMHGESLPGDLLEMAAGLVDMAYGDRATPAMRRAHDLGIPAADGLDVLVAQAAASFFWWTDIPAPVNVMQRAARGG